MINQIITANNISEDITAKFLLECLTFLDILEGYFIINADVNEWESTQNFITHYGKSHEIIDNYILIKENNKLYTFSITHHQSRNIIEEINKLWKLKLLF